MRILVGKTFGIGNAVLSVPMIRAICSLPEVSTVDILVGTGPDDLGAREVFQRLKVIEPKVTDIYLDWTGLVLNHYDVAIMAIPFDGRWQNGRDFVADRVRDGRKRPDNVDRLGFDMWKKHEAEYQMDNARELGFSGPTPSSHFMSVCDDGCCAQYRRDVVYLGIGYKRDPGGFGLSKHWGNENYVRFMTEAVRLRPGVSFVSTGTVQDLIQVGAPLTYHMNKTAGWKNLGLQPPRGRYSCQMVTLDKSFDTLAECGAYFGNDTGLMHCAASIGIPTFGMTPYPDLLVKNPPLCDRGRMDLFGDEPELVAQKFVEFVWG